RERADVIGLEHRHVLERAERAVAIALRAQHARLLPEELRHLRRIVGGLEAARHDGEQRVVFFAFADRAKNTVECALSHGVALERLRKRTFAALFVSERVPPRVTDLLPER